MRRILKNKKGITLISLVVTIIVLLILAGISIAMLSGDNGLLKRVGQAKEDTIVGGEKEQVELAYLSAAVKNLGGNVTGQNLQDELDASVGENKTTVTGTSTLKVKFEDTQNEYKVSRDGKVEKKNNNPNEIEEKDAILGTYISNYPVEGEWRLFHYGQVGSNGDSRIYLISADAINYTLSINGFKNANLGYNGTEDFDNSNTFKTNYPAIDQGIFYKTYKNGIVHYSSNLDNMKFTQFMLDSSRDIWKTYMDKNDGNGFADYAIGGPTLELFLESYNTNKANNEKINFSETTPSGNGYNVTITDTFSMGSVYRAIGGNAAYWIAGPHEDWNTYVLLMSSQGKLSNITSSNASYRFRPIVCMNSNVKLEKDKDNHEQYVLIESTDNN